jgi:CheY-like chemotaxis protein
VVEEKIILVVEDERPLLEVISSKLEKSGYAVVTAQTVQAALNLIKDIPKIDAIWLDHYLLGKEDGLDFVAKLKQDGSAWKKVPIFVVSNTATPDKQQAYVRLGVNKYYTKINYRLDDIVENIGQELKAEKKGGG